MSKVSILSKGTVLATVIALALATVSATSAFAAGSTTTATSTQAVSQNLEKNWKAELSSLQFENAFFGRVDRMLDNFGSQAKDANHAGRTKDNTPMAFRSFSYFLNKAEAIVSTHAGFDASGNVTDQTQATKSVEDLNIYLSQLRGVLIYKLRNII